MRKCDCGGKGRVTDCRQTLTAIRRRLECRTCGARWTTVEVGRGEDGASWANAHSICSAIDELNTSVRALAQKVATTSAAMTKQADTLARRARMIEVEINEKLPEPERTTADDHDE